MKNALFGNFFSCCLSTKKPQIPDLIIFTVFTNASVCSFIESRGKVLVNVFSQAVSESMSVYSVTLYSTL